VLQFRRPFVDAYINNAGVLGFGAFFENPDGAESRRRPARFGESQRSIESALSSIEPVAAAGRRAGIASWWIMRRRAREAAALRTLHHAQAVCDFQASDVKIFRIV